MKRLLLLTALLITILPSMGWAIGQDMDFPSVSIPKASYMTRSEGGFTVTIPTTWVARNIGFDNNTSKPAIDVYVEAENQTRPIKYVKVLLDYIHPIGRYESEYLYHSTPLSYSAFEEDERVVATFGDGSAQQYNGYHYWMLYASWEELASRYFDGITVKILTVDNEWVSVEFPWTHLRPSQETVQSLPEGTYPIAETHFGPVSEDESKAVSEDDTATDEEAAITPEEIIRFVEEADSGLGIWNATGAASEETAIGTVIAPEGDRQILVRADASHADIASRGELVSFLGISHPEIHGAGGPGAWALKGSAIRQESAISVEAGQSVTLKYNFLTNEPTGGNPDYAFLALVSSDGSEKEVVRIANASLPMSGESPGGGFARQTGYQTFTHTFREGGSFFIGVGVVNSGANRVESAIALDGIRITSAPVSIQLEVSISEEDLGLIDAAAAREGLDRAEFFVEAAKRVAQDGNGL